MKTNEAISLIGQREFLDKIYQFAYRRCNTAFEAEDLCSEIILKVIQAVKKQEYIDNFYAFVWTVAHRVYADHCQKQSRVNSEASFENCGFDIYDTKDDIEDFIEESAEAQQLKKVIDEIAFLSKIYRDVMVMFYIDEMKVRDIAVKLGIGETTVKQRLFSARNTVKKEVEKMDNKNLSLKPIRFKYIGTGNPIGNDPSIAAQRLLSQNIVYLCKDRAKSAKEIALELCVPMPFIEEELEYLVTGCNGEYGMLRRLENGKYISNIIVADYKETLDALNIYDKYLPECVSLVKASAEINKEAIFAFPFLSEQNDLSFILWPIVYTMVHRIKRRINSSLSEKYFKDIKFSGRPYTQTAIAFTEDEWISTPGIEGYGRDVISANEVGGHKTVDLSNIYGPDMYPHFHCGHNISTDKLILMTIRAIGGLDIGSLSETEKEIAAKAISEGYLRKEGSALKPNILVYESSNGNEFYNFGCIDDSANEIADKIAGELAEFIKAHLPEHLMADCLFYAELVAGWKSQASLIQTCIKEGILCDPRTAGAGVELIVTK